MQLSDLQSLVTSWVDDPNNTYFSLPIINVFLNNAQREVQKQLLQSTSMWYCTPVQTPTVIGQNTYNLPSDLVKLHRVEVVTSGTPPNEASNRLERFTLNMQDLIPTGMGTPVAHSEASNILYIWPACDTQNLPLRLWYSPLVVDMALSTDVPNVPIQYQEYIAVLATIDCFLKDRRNPAEWLTKKAYYLELMKQDASNRSQDGPRSIVITQGEDFGPLF